MIVECNVASKTQKRLDSWVEKGFAAQNPMETGSFMMCPSDTFYVTVEPYTLTLNQGIYDPDEAYCHVIISQKKGIETEEVTRLLVKMTPPPKPPSPRLLSPIMSPIPAPATSPPQTPRSVTLSSSVASSGSCDSQRQHKSKNEVRERLRVVLDRQND
ncbi:hypothetical protein MAR_022994, partial [Mya arenaria]